MTTLKNYRHEFNLTGLKAGESFIGCKTCWFQYAVGTIVSMKSRCPICLQAELGVFTVTPEDVAAAKESSP